MTDSSGGKQILFRPKRTGFDVQLSVFQSRVLVEFYAPNL